MPVVFVCFDMPYFGGVDLRAAPYSDRRRYLSQCLLPSPLRAARARLGGRRALHEAALASGFEGVIGKRIDSRYEAGKRSHVLAQGEADAERRVRGRRLHEGKGSRASLGAILVGYWEAGKLRYASHVGSGFDDARRRMKARLEQLERRSCPFAEKPPC